jgi:hypothetical protein
MTEKEPIEILAGRIERGLAPLFARVAVLEERAAQRDGSERQA